MRFPFPVSVKVQRQSGTDRNGNPLPTTTHTLTDVAHAPRNTSELIDGRDTVLSGEWLWCQLEDDIRADDRVWLPRDDPNKPAPWFVDGEVEVYDSHPFTTDPDALFKTCVISRVTG